MMSDSPRPAPECLTPPSGALIVPTLPSCGAIDLSIVLPTFNEVQNILETIRQLSAVLNGVAGLSFEILVVDDDSPDRTWEAVQRLASTAEYAHVRVMRRQTERGLATAVIRGWQASRGRILGVMDADLQHPPEVVAGLLAAIRNGATLAVGSRTAEGGGVSDWSPRRRMLSRAAQLLGLLILPEVIGRVGDAMSGCLLVRREALAGITLSPAGYKILVEVLARGRVSHITEVGYVFRERRLGSSNVSLRVHLEYLQHLLRLRFALLLRNSFARFCLVGACGVVIDMLTLYLLSDPSRLHWGLTRSKIIAAELALISNFLMNDAWTFSARTGAQRGFQAKFHRFLKFNAICGVGLLLNVAILNILFNLLGLNRYLANGVAILLVTLWNYTLNSKFGWRTTEAATERKDLP
jgi:dolichol-phosphate mannosyltransferase